MFRQSSPSVDTGNTGARNGLTSKVIMGAILIFFLVSCFVFMVHLCLVWFFQRSSRRSASASLHIISGLDKAAIAQLPTFVYRTNPLVDDLEAGRLDKSDMWTSLECAVCLSEFQENEKGRMLPSCQHAFHRECIDMWLFSHTTCPLCRAKVMPAMATSASTPSTHEQCLEGNPSTTQSRDIERAI